MATEANTTVTETNKAENSEGDPKGNAGNAAAVSTPEPEQAAKTFTQAELDAIVKQRLERQAKGQPSKEEISAAENGKAEAEKRAAAAEAKCLAFSKGVSNEAVEDVIALAMNKVDDNTPIDKAIDAVIAKYPSFCSAKSEAPNGITTGVSFNKGGGSQMSGVEAAFLAKNPGIKI